MAPSNVTLACKASRADLEAAVEKSYSHLEDQFWLSVVHSSHLTDQSKSSVWRIFEDNMRHSYEKSSFGWDVRSKQKELFHALSRFILVEHLETKNLVAYIMFRFEKENLQKVVYCYELQVAAHARRQGLGRLLTEQLRNIGKILGMKKVMLTVFKENVEAMKFYQSLGFELDETSPDFPVDDEWEDEDAHCDYSILSQLIY